MIFKYFTRCQAEGLPPDQLSVTEAFYNAGGVWTQDIKQVTASYFANNSSQGETSPKWGDRLLHLQVAYQI